MLLGSAGGAATVEIEARVVDLKAHVARQALGDRPDVGLVDLLDATAARAGEVVVVLRKTGHVGVHVSILLETPGDAGLDEGLQRAEDGRSSDARLLLPEAAVELVGAQLTPIGSEGVGHQ